MTIVYTSITTNQIGEFGTPLPGNTFLVLTLTLNNQGYDSFSANPSYFSGVVNNVSYDYSEQGSDLPGEFSTADVLSGGMLTGKICL